MLGPSMTKLIIVVDEKTRSYGELLSALVSMKDDKLDENGIVLPDGIVGIKDGSVEAVVWDEKIYADNLATLGSSVKVLFIGDSDSAKPIMANINFDNEFSPYGVFFGSLGNRAVIYADRKKLSNKKKYDEFINAYSSFIIGVGTEYTEAQNVEAVRVVEDVGIERREKILSLINKGINELNKGLVVVKEAPQKLKKGISKTQEPEETGSIEEKTKKETDLIIPSANEKHAKIVDAALQALTVYIWPAEIVQQISLGLVRAKSSKGILDQQYRCAVVAYYVTRLAEFME